MVAVASAASVLATTLEYVTTRTAFGKPIGSFQNTRFVLAELETEIDDRAHLRRPVRRQLNAGELTGVDAAMAKWWTTELQNEVADRCLQLHGGYGYMREYPVAEGLARQPGADIYGGTNEIMKEIVGRSLGL